MEGDFYQFPDFQFPFSGISEIQIPYPSFPENAETKARLEGGLRSWGVIF